MYRRTHISVDPLEETPESLADLVTRALRCKRSVEIGLGTQGVWWLTGPGSNRISDDNSCMADQLYHLVNREVGEIWMGYTKYGVLFYKIDPIH